MCCTALYCPSLAHTVFQRQKEFYLFPIIQQHISLHTQASLKKFMDYIQTSAVDKMVKFLDKGLDPNFQDADTGGEECLRASGFVTTPLSFSISLSSIHFIHRVIFCLSSIHNNYRLHLQLFKSIVYKYLYTSNSSHSRDE